MMPEQQQRILGYFIEEAKDHLNTIEQGLLNLQATIEDSDTVNEVFRAAHSVKGGAAMLCISSVQRTAHRLEDFFKTLKEASHTQVDRQLESMFLQVFDGLQALIEELQGPFGLTEDKSQEVMAELEPVFEQLENHLNTLVASAGEATPQTAPAAAAPATAPRSARKTAPSSEESALKLVFKSDVPVHLREMLTLFKQSDSAASRAALQQCCDALHRIGEQFDLSHWCELTTATRQAVGNAAQTYRTLAPVLIKELKKAQEQVLNNQAEEIGISPDLVALLPEPVAAETTADDLDAFLQDALSPAETEPDLTDLFQSESQPVTDEETLDWLDAGTAEETAAASPDSSSDPTAAASDPLFEEAPETVEQSPAASATPSPGREPSVGAAELNSLADLFEGEVAGLGSPWEEVLPGDPGVPPDSPDIDISEAFSDLLDDGLDDSTGETQQDLADLFGDSTLAGNDSESPDFSDLTETVSTSSDDEFADLFDLEETSASTEPASSTDANSDLDLDDLLDSVGHQTEPPSTEATETGAAPEMDSALEDLGDLFEQDSDEVVADLDTSEEEADSAIAASPEEVIAEPASPETAETGSEAAAAASVSFDEFEEIEDPWAAETEMPDETDESALDALDELWTESQHTPAAAEPLDPSPATADASDNAFADLSELAFTDDSDDLADLTGELESLSDSDDDTDLSFLLEETDTAEVTGASSAREQLAPETAADAIPSLDQASSETDEGDDLFDGQMDVAPAPSSDEFADLFDEPESESPEGGDSAEASVMEASQAALDSDFDLFSPSENEAVDDLGDFDDFLEDNDSTADAANAADASAIDPFAEEDDAQEADIDAFFEAEADSSPPTTEAPEASAVDELFFEDAGDGSHSQVATDRDLSSDSSQAEDTDVTNLDFLEDEAVPDTADDAFDSWFEDDTTPSSTTSGDLDLDSLDLEDSADSAPGAAPDQATSSEADLDDLGDLFSDGQVVPEQSPETTDWVDSRATDLDDLEGLLTEAADLSESDDTIEAVEDEHAALADNFDDLLTDTATDDHQAAQVSLSATSPEQGVATDFAELDDLLEPDAPPLEQDEQDSFDQSPLDESEAADQADPADQQNDAGADFDELEALLDDDPAAGSESVAAPESLTAEQDEVNFDELEALLEEDTDDTVEAETSEPPVAAEDEEDEFSDLEKLLEEADQALGGSSPTIRSTSGGRPPRRIGAMVDQTMRVSVRHLDNLNNLVGELVVNRNSLEQDQERMRQFLDNLMFQVQQLNDVGQRMRDLYERSLLESSLISSRQAFQGAGVSRSGNGHSGNAEGSHATGATFDALEMDRFTGFHTLSQEMIELIVRVRESASDIAYTVESSDQITHQFRQVTTQLQEGLNKARMVPFAQTADRLPRAVRDISLKCGKEAQLIVEGRETLIDKMILERLYDPMTHLVNNAITHGIETPEERAAVGKPREGTITVRAFYQGNQTVIYIADDGAGINPDLVKQKAIKKGLITQAEADSMNTLETYELLFRPGFSTRDKADDFAGRGVGMDVVRTALSEIRGSITIDSELGRGTSFTIRLPLTLSISKALSCLNNQAHIAFPMDGVEDMFDVPKERVQVDTHGHSYLSWRDTTLSFYPLSELLQFNRALGRGRVYGGSQDDDMVSIVVLRSASTYIGVQVDRVLGEQEIVIKQIEGPVPKPMGIAGATVLGDGRIMPIADVLELIDIAQGRVRREAGSSIWSQQAEAPPQEPLVDDKKTEPTVLIVDDSITVRELLSMSFNKVGYRVEQARDGQEAWEKLRSGLPCDLVFCDIEMPRMDGLELLSRMQKDSTLSRIPIAMLTSRGADRHRQMALDLGASGYFTKPYLEEALLDAAQRMLSGSTHAKW